MGKWTPDYIDDVLHSKIKNLVSGAIKRSAIEKTEPTISYEDFVHDLETGDSFTTSLVDVLVKELAERRKRPNVNDDRRLIAERSAKSLRQLAAPQRIYRDHNVGRYMPRRRSATLPDYLGVPPPEVDIEEDEDIFEHMLDNTTFIEGARINSELYDAYGGGQSSRPISSPSPPAEEVTSPLPPPPATYFRSAPWSATSGPSVLTRQPSLRRATRSIRSVDFNEFTHRRRSSTRENQSFRGEPGESQEHWEPLRHSQTTRRFFPFMRTRRSDAPDSWSPDIHSSHESEDTVYPAEPSHAPWFSLTPPVHRDTTMDEVLADAELSDERAHAGPALRLRRAPESIMSRHPSPLPGLVHSHEHLYVDAAPAAEPSHAHEEIQSPAEPSGYPTPGSTEHEFFA
ncbi:hypothetical protein C0991_006254 [Blastosporella zonata]|nr:hypothetical protein C0991_006254 [Blastosporella zonata]